MSYAVRFCGVQDFQSEQHYTALRRDGNCLPRSKRNMWDGYGKVWNFGSVAIAQCALSAVDGGRVELWQLPTKKPRHLGECRGRCDKK